MPCDKREAFAQGSFSNEAVPNRPQPVHPLKADVEGSRVQLGLCGDEQIAKGEI